MSSRFLFKFETENFIHRSYDPWLTRPIDLLNGWREVHHDSRSRLTGSFDRLIKCFRAAAVADVDFFTMMWHNFFHYFLLIDVSRSLETRNKSINEGNEKSFQPGERQESQFPFKWHWSEVHHNVTRISFGIDANCRGLDAVLVFREVQVSTFQANISLFIGKYKIWGKQGYFVDTCFQSLWSY